MRKKQGLILTSLMLSMAGSLISPAPLARDGRPNVVVDVVALKEVLQRDATGRETVLLKSADSTSPGDTIVYRIACRNDGSAPAHDAQIVDPIPAGTTLVPRSWDAQAGEFMVSVDGGKTFESFPIRREIRQNDGSTALKEVDLTQYTHVRWTSKELLPPGGTRSTAFKVKVR